MRNTVDLSTVMWRKRSRAWEGAGGSRAAVVDWLGGFGTEVTALARGSSISSLDIWCGHIEVEQMEVQLVLLPIVFYVTKILF